MGWSGSAADAACIHCACFAGSGHCFCAGRGFVDSCAAGRWRGAGFANGLHFVLPIPNAVTHLGLYLAAIAAGTVLSAVLLGALKKSVRA